jgi:hypothetical protein
MDASTYGREELNKVNLHRGNGSRGPAGTSGGGTPPDPGTNAEKTAATAAAPDTEVRGPATAEPAPEAPPAPPETLSPAPASFPAPVPHTATPSAAQDGRDDNGHRDGRIDRGDRDGDTTVAFGKDAAGDRAGEPAGEAAEDPAKDPAGWPADVDRLSVRMDRAVRGFVDDPQRAVREADSVLDAATELIERRRKELRQGWDGGHRADTEELRVALTHYRDLTRRLISLTTAS